MCCLIIFLRGAVVTDVSVLVETIVLWYQKKKTQITVYYYASNKTSLHNKRSLNVCMLGLKTNLILL